MILSVESQIAELEEKRSVLLQKLHVMQEFWAEVELTLLVNGVNTIQHLPIEARQAVEEMTTNLPSQSELQVELAQVEGELATLVTQLRNAA